MFSLYPRALTVPHHETEAKAISRGTNNGQKAIRMKAPLGERLFLGLIVVRADLLP
jgi:hypothetical protein